MHIPTLPINDLAILIHKHQISRRHPAKGLAMRVDPEVVRQDRVADSYVPAGTFVVVAVQSKPA